MSYPSMTEYQDAVQHPAQAFFDSDLKRGSVRTSNLGLPVAMSGGFALTYSVTTPIHKCAVRCFHRDIPSIEKKYELISKKLKLLNSKYFVNFDFQNPGVKVHLHSYPIVKMDWVEGDPLGVWLDKKYSSAADLQNARTQFREISTFLEKEGMAHGDIQNGNVMMASAGAKLIDYDGMFVPGMAPGHGSEVGHKHFQHPRRSTSDFGPKMDRFSFIVVDLSLAALLEDKSLHPRFRNGGETIIFTANDFADPRNSTIFQILSNNTKLKDVARNFAAVCEADITAVPTLEDFLVGKNIPVAKARADIRIPTSEPRKVAYISAFPVIDALDFEAAARHVGDKIELIGQIVGVKEDFGKRGRGKNRPYVFINFGHWRGNIVKISIWSEGLDKLKEKPSQSWVGRWVSVTGLLDPPYSSKRYGYTHLSVTVQEDGQIQTLDETQARFRLGKGTTQRATGKGTATAQPSGTPTKAGSANTTSNQAILKRFGATQPKPTPQPQPWATSSQPRPHSPSQGTSHVQQWSLSRVPAWAWVVGFLVLAYWLFGGSDSSKHTRPSGRTSAVPTQPVPTRPEQNPGSRDIARLPEPSIKAPAPSPTPTPVPAPNLFPRPQSPTPPTETGRTSGPVVIPPTNYLPLGPPAPNVAMPLPAPVEIKPVGPSAPEPNETGSLGSAPTKLLDLRLPSDVQLLQRRLFELGFNPGNANGVWGAQTQQAFVDFQSINGIRTERTLAQTTQERLFSSTAIRPSPTTAATYIGEWVRDVAQCQSGEGRTVITPKRAEAFGAFCDFNSVQNEPSAWRIQARCVNEDKAWIANIRLLRAERRLIWSSERGTAEYVRCD